MFLNQSYNLQIAVDAQLPVLKIGKKIGVSLMLYSSVVFSANAQSAPENQEEMPQVFEQSLFDAEREAAASAVSQRENIRVGSLPTTLEEAIAQGRILPEQAQSRVLDDVNTGTPSARANTRQEPDQAGEGRADEDDPFAPLGFRVGSWSGNASVEQVIGYSTNLNRAAMGDGGFYSQTDGTVTLRSDWSRHQAQIEATGAYRRNLTSDSTAIPSASINGELRLDIREGTALTLSTGYNYSTESTTSRELGIAVSERPVAHNFNASAELSSEAQRFSYSLRGSVERNAFEDAKLITGRSRFQNDRYNNVYAATARLAYEVSPMVKPFVEITAQKRDFDWELDRNGQNRDRMNYSISVGSEYDLGEKLQGEFSIGYQYEDNEDAALDDRGSMTFDAELEWSPVRQTTVGLSASTDFDGSTQAGDSGTITQTLQASIERRATDRLNLELRAGSEITRTGDDNTDTILLNSGAGFQYSINRNLALTGDVDYEKSLAGTAGSRYDAATVQAGIRWQK